MASTVSKARVWDALHTLGIEQTADNCEQLEVLVESLLIYGEREKARGGLWKAAGAVDSAHHLKSKGGRVKHAVDHAMPDAGLDDAHDAVNYAVFYVRNVRAGRLVDDQQEDLP